jgi:hypothetical protein
MVKRGSVELHEASIVPGSPSQLVRYRKAGETHQSLPVERTDEEATVDEFVTPAFRVWTRSSITVDMVG